LKNADANEVATALRALKPKSAEIVIYQSLNMLIITASHRTDALIKIAQSIDSKYGPQEKKFQVKGLINVVHLENANAEDLANVSVAVPFSESAKIDTSPLPHTVPADCVPSDKARRCRRNRP